MSKQIWWICLLIILLFNYNLILAKPTIYHWDLRYTSSFDYKLQYDTRHAAVCIQGIVNRDAPRLFLTFNDYDLIWLNRLTEPGGLCEGWNIFTINDITDCMAIFGHYIKGIVLYDQSLETGVISTSLAATTAAANEDAIAIRKDSNSPIYQYLITDAAGLHLPILLDLAGKFTGTGIIWQTTTPSTDSAKCDAYIWAKEKYLDSGKCDPATLMYTLDLWGCNSNVDLRTQLSNLDYAVMKKGFCFELSPWGDEIPNDDPAQPIGTDLATFKEILNSCNQHTGYNKAIKFCGFINWDQKYTDYVGGNHSPVATEWELARVLSAYNVYIEGDAPGLTYVSNASFYNGLTPEIRERRYVQNPAPSYNNMVEKGLIDANGNVVPGNYVMLYMGDYDQASWSLYWLGSDRYNDPARGQTYCNWAMTPNTSDRIPVVYDYMYRNKTSNDYFIAGNSGAGYINPTQLYADRNPSGYSSGVNLWQQHCREYYRLWDYSITGWLLNGSTPMTPTDAGNFSPFSGDGIGMETNTSYQSLVNNIAVLARSGPDDPQGLSDIINYSSGVHFAWYRTILYYPSQIKAIEDSCAGSGHNHHFLDAYSFYYLLRYYLGGTNNYRATWVTDTIPRVMAVNQSYPVTITVRNDGWDSWSETQGYRLGYAIVSQDKEPNSADYDSHGRAYITGGGTIGSGQNVSFSFNVTAPSTPGIYDIYYDMVKENTTWFREANNIEWKKQIIVAVNEIDVDTDGDGVADVVEEQEGRLYWHPYDTLTCGGWGYMSADISGVSGKPDCYVNMLDLAAMALEWLQTGADLQSDLTGSNSQPDGKTDLFDYAKLASQWLMCTDPCNEDCPSRPRVANGDFEFSPDFVHWRTFAIGGTEANFTISTDAYSGSKAASMDVTVGGGDHAMDKDNNRIAVSPGEMLDLSFASKKISGINTRLLVTISEFDSSGAYLEKLGTGLFRPITTAYTVFDYYYQVQDSNTAFINIGFRITDVASNKIPGHYLIDKVELK
jgi:hypothetical protein